jgi:hypothetical protein
LHHHGGVCCCCFTHIRAKILNLTIKNIIVSDCDAIEQSICVMPFSTDITNDNLYTKKHCVNDEIVLGIILYILSYSY